MTGKVIDAMISFFGNDSRRIGHALKVYGYTLCIAEAEDFTQEETRDAVFAAVLHDVGIKVAEEKFGSFTYKQQEELGPPVAQAILAGLGVPGETIDRVSHIIAHHHTPNLVSEEPVNRPFCALIEADFIVNLEEGNIPRDSLEKVRGRYFTTGGGRKILSAIFDKK